MAQVSTRLSALVSFLRLSALVPFRFPPPSFPSFHCCPALFLPPPIAVDLTASQSQAQREAVMRVWPLSDRILPEHRDFRDLISRMLEVRGGGRARRRRV
eukprot:750309-Hanusia_phi.AAC.3